MRLLVILFATLLAGPAFAHPGHLADVAGHNHWVAGAAIGAAVLAGILGALKGRKERESEDRGETEEQPA